MPLLDEQLRTLLICPACGGELEEDEANSQLRCRACAHLFPVRDFPVMLLNPETTDEES